MNTASDYFGCMRPYPPLVCDSDLGQKGIALDRYRIANLHPYPGVAHVLRQRAQIVPQPLGISIR